MVSMGGARQMVLGQPPAALSALGLARNLSGSTTHTRTISPVPRKLLSTRWRTTPLMQNLPVCGVMQAVGTCGMPPPLVPTHTPFTSLVVIGSQVTAETHFPPTRVAPPSTSQSRLETVPSL